VKAQMLRAEAAGLSGGVLLDALIGDPTPGHPVALFGRGAAALEGTLWRDSRRSGFLYTALLLGVGGAGSFGALRLFRTPRRRALLTAVAAWAALGGRTLGQEAEAVAAALEADDIDGARRRLRSLCSRDPEALDPAGIVRSTIESVAENTSDAVVAPLAFGAVAGVPGLLLYRAVNTLDAMVGYRNERYARFGFSAARLDDLCNLLPARLTCALAVVLAPLVGGSPRTALRAWRKDGRAHESPNAGRVEASFAGALGLRLGGSVHYPHGLVVRPAIGAARVPEVADVARALRLSRAVSLAAVLIAVAVRLGLAPRKGRL
jgi:adenosylcobinamide-phosphate synthase